MAHHASQGLEKFSKFDILETPYKVVNSQGIKAYVLTPKTITLGKHPIIVEFHGGFLVSPIIRQNFYHTLTSSRSQEQVSTPNGILSGVWITLFSTQRSL